MKPIKFLTETQFRAALDGLRTSSTISGVFEMTEPEEITLELIFSISPKPTEPCPTPQ